MLFSVDQVIVGHMHAQTELFCTGMAMSDMHTLTSPLPYSQRQRHFLLRVRG